MSILQNPYRGVVCSVTGKMIVTNSEWDIETPSYTVFFGVIDKRVILLQSIGKATEYTSNLYEAHFSKVVREGILSGATYATCDDYRYFEHSTNRSRLVFLANIEKNHKLLKSICFYHVRPFFNFVIKISKRLLPVHFKVDIAQNYDEAVRCAFSYLQVTVPQKPKVSNDLKSYITYPEWKYQVGNSEHEYRIYRSNIIYNKLAEGLTLEQVEKIAQIDILVNQEIQRLNGNRDFYSIVDLTDVKKISHKVRKLYADKMAHNDKSYPCSYSVILGNSFFSYVAVYLARLVMPYPTDYANSMERALELITQYHSGRNQIQHEFTRQRTEIDDFISYLSSMEWKNDELHFESSIPTDSHISPAYEAIEIIRSDLNQLLAQQKEKERQLQSLSRQLQEANENLEQHVAERTNEIEQKNRMMSLLYAKVSHDLRTPLQGIMSFARFGRDKADRVDHLTVKRYFDNILYSSDSLLRLINQLLDFNQLTSGKMTYTMNVQNIDVVVRAVRSFMSCLFEERKIELVISNIPDLCFSFDPLRIEQVLTNLLGNALKFSPVGGQVFLRILPSADKCTIEVEDRGIGIPQSDMNKLFDVFHQCSNNTSSSSGSGLGLTICKEIVQAHGGEISVHHASPQGALFRIELPLDPSFSI